MGAGTMFHIITSSFPWEDKVEPFRSQIPYEVDFNMNIRAVSKSLFTDGEEDA